ncbi:MAG: rhomboid family intramembrane serine protease [Gammaproteobacteria bacterium]|nr:rhomboid family intramembrane serine protease [Gammaproteobacteria bacterium]NNL07420.1 rhomboid family intramembrane serine protease [Gammaproteobacteria bacterium]
MFPIHDDNPTRITPYVTYLILAACILVFIWQLSLGDGVQLAVYSFGVIPSVLFESKSLPAELAVLPAWMTIFTSMFLHGGWMHLIGNMLYLWVFGNNVEDAMGHGRFIVFYLCCGLLAALTQAAFDPQSEIPMIGASGAISGVLGAYLLLHPHARILVIVPIGFIVYTPWIAAYWVLGFWFILQLINSMLSASEVGGVAYGAHLGGFVAGMLLIPLFKYRSVHLFSPIRKR